jgi:hypothetical protein
VGAGGSLEAAYTLAGPVHAGSWHLVGDGIIFDSVDVTFDVLWRSSAGDMKLVEFSHHFDPQPSGYNAVPFEADAVGVAAPAHAGDKLVLRFSASQSTAQGLLYQPNSDGANAMGRIPSVKLPP